MSRPFLEEMDELIRARYSMLYDQAMFYYQKATEFEPNHQLAIKRQRNCMPKLYGLMRIFGRDSLKRKWDKEFNKQIKPE